MNNIKTAKQLVEHVLATYPETRNSDKELIIKLLELKHVKIDYYDKERLQDFPAFETITRCRRKYQSEGKYEASDKVKALRKKQEQLHRSTFKSVRFVGDVAYLES